MIEQEIVTVREGRSGVIRTTLSDNDRRQLAALAQHPGYQVLLDLMEMECIKQETLLVNLSAHETKKVLAAHAQSQAMWRFFVRLQKSVSSSIAELFAHEPEPTEEQVKDARIAGILDPTKE